MAEIRASTPFIPRSLNSTNTFHKKHGNNWIAIFNKNAPLQFDLSLFRAFEHSTCPRCVQFSSDGRYIAVGCFGGVSISDWRTGCKVASFYEDETNLSTPFALRIAFRPDGRYLVGLMTDGSLRIWDIKTCESQNVETGLGTDCHWAISHDGSMLVSAKENTGIIKLWDLSVDSSPSFQKRASLQTERNVARLAISRDKRYVAASDSQGYVTIWDTENGFVVTELDCREGNIIEIAFSSTAQDILMAANDRLV